MAGRYHRYRNHMKRIVTLLLIAISIDASAQLAGLNDKTVQDI